MDVALDSRPGDPLPPSADSPLPPSAAAVSALPSQPVSPLPPSAVSPLPPSAAAIRCFAVDKHQIWCYVCKCQMDIRHASEAFLQKHIGGSNHQSRLESFSASPIPADAVNVADALRAALPRKRDLQEGSIRTQYKEERKRRRRDERESKRDELQ